MKIRTREPLGLWLRKCPEFWLVMVGLEIVVFISALILGDLW